jgi:hypothetical protein
VAVEDADLPLLLALGGGAARNGIWAALALPQLGALAAADAGLDLDCGLWVDHPGSDWPQVLAVLMEAVPVVLIGSLGRPAERITHRIAALQRRTGAVLLVAGPWEGAQVRLRVAEAVWEGVSAGHGLLRGRRVRVVAAGRGVPGAGRSTVLWLPGPDGVTGVAYGPATGTPVPDRTPLPADASLPDGTALPGRTPLPDVLSGSG